MVRKITNDAKLDRLFGLLVRLKKARIHYRLDQIRDDYIMIDVTVPGERWEIEIPPEGDIEIEIYRSDGQMFDEKKLGELFEKFSDD